MLPCHLAAGCRTLHTGILTAPTAHRLPHHRHRRLQPRCYHRAPHRRRRRRRYWRPRQHRPPRRAAVAHPLPSLPPQQSPPHRPPLLLLPARRVPATTASATQQQGEAYPWCAGSPMLQQIFTLLHNFGATMNCPIHNNMIYSPHSTYKNCCSSCPCINGVCHYWQLVPASRHVCACLLFSSTCYASTGSKVGRVGAHTMLKETGRIIMIIISGTKPRVWWEGADFRPLRCDCKGDFTFEHNARPRSRPPWLDVEGLEEEVAEVVVEGEGEGVVRREGCRNWSSCIARMTHEGGGGGGGGGVVAMRLRAVRRAPTMCMTPMCVTWRQHTARRPPTWARLAGHALS